MAEQIVRDAKLWMDGVDLTADLSSIVLDYGAEVVENSTLGNSTRSRLGGLKTIGLSSEGYWNSTPDDKFFSSLGVADVPFSIGKTDGSDGTLAYTMKGIQGQYSPGGSIGEMFAFSVSAEATGDLIDGTIMHNAARTASGNGTARQLGAISAGQKLYAVMHVIAASGTTPTLDVIVESDDNESFTSGVTRATFTQKVAIGSQWIEVDGPITDDWWRISYTIGGTTPSFTFVNILGIQ